MLRASGWFFLFAIWMNLGVVALADPVPVRVVAANLSSGRQQGYAADGPIEGAGARILKGLKPDVVLIQEFNTAEATEEWVSRTFGREYRFSREDGKGIPNGVVSRFPIAASGEWDDPTQTNRDFAWAKIALPNGRHLWAVSVHLKAGNERTMRLQQAEELVRRIRGAIPEADYLVLGGDFNTSSRNEPCMMKLGELFHVAAPHPVDQQAQDGTNSSRRKPYDWVVADADLKAKQVPTRIGGAVFPAGLVVDTRVFQPLPSIAPAHPGDSAVAGMQHMAVVKDFLIP